MKCSNCKSEIPEKSKFCPHCGKKQFDKRNLIIGIGIFLIIVILLINYRQQIGLFMWQTFINRLKIIRTYIASGS